MSEENEKNEESVTRIAIKFHVEELGEVKAEFVRHLAPRTVDAITKKLPIEGRAALWKEEVYFEIPVTMGDEKAKPKVEKGAIAYWPMGKALCIFFGDSQPYSPVNVIGGVSENLDRFSKVKSGTRIRVERI